MKAMRLLSGILAICMLTSACQAEETTKKSKKSKKSTKSKVTTESIETEPTEPDDDPSDSSDTSEMTVTRTTDVASILFPDAPVLEIGPHETAPYAYQKVEIAEQTVWNENGVTITATGYKLENKISFYVLLHVVNQSGHPVSILSDSGYMDGFYVSAYSSAELEDGMEDDAHIMVYSSLGSYIGDWNPGLIEVSFKIEFPDIKQTQQTPYLPIHTSLEGQVQIMDFSCGAELYNDGSIRAVAYDFHQKDNKDYALYIYVENNSDTDYYVKDGITYLNGMETDPFVMERVDAHKKCVAEVRFYKDDLESWGVCPPIKEILISLAFAPVDDFFNEQSTDPVRVKV